MSLFRPADLRRLVIALIAEEAGVFRNKPVEPGEWSSWGDDLRIDEDGIGLDSLGMQNVIERVNVAFHLHEVGSEDYLFIRRTIGEWVDVITQTLDMKNERLSFWTSGSTGAAKPVEQTVSDLVREIEDAQAAFGRPERIFALANPAHIYGFLFTVLAPSLWDVELIDVRSSAPGRALREARQGDWIVATPPVWKFVAGPGRRFKPGVTGLTSGAAMPVDLADSLKTSGLDRLIEIYGSSETAGIGWRKDCRGGFTLFEGVCFDDDRVERQSGPVDLQDHLKFDDQGRFTLAGRKDHMVQVAGINVSPNQIARQLIEAELCSHAYIRLDTSQEEARLKAYLVPAETDKDEAGLEADIRAWCEAHLSWQARPHRYTFGTALPRNEAGKLTDWAV